MKRKEVIGTVIAFGAFGFSLFYFGKSCYDLGKIIGEIWGVKKLQEWNDAIKRVRKKFKDTEED